MDMQTPEPSPPASPAKPPARDWVPGAFALRDTWFPLVFSAHVGGRPVRRTIHSQPYYVWREKDAIRATEYRPDTPVQRRPPTSELTGGTGEFPVAERYGYVWVWYGDPNRANEALIPDVPYLPRDRSLPSYTRGTNRFDCSAELSLENLLDLTHADFLHASVVGDEISDDDRIEVEATSETVTMIRNCVNKSVAPVMRWVGGVRAKYQDVRAVIHVHVRSSVALAYGRYRPGYDVPLFHPCIPETHDRCRLPYTFNTTHQPGLFRYVMPKSGYVVGPQDNIMVRPQSPRYAEAVERRDLHSRFDGAGVRYRFLRQQLAERQQGGDMAYLPDGDPGVSVSSLLGISA